MMLETATRVPPSCAAMLPQKFSAAATCSFPADDPPETPADPPHPVSAGPAAQTASAARTASRDPAWVRRVSPRRLTEPAPYHRIGISLDPMWAGGSELARRLERAPPPRVWRRAGR